MALFLASR